MIRAATWSLWGGLGVLWAGTLLPETHTAIVLWHAITPWWALVAAPASMASAWTVWRGRERAWPHAFASALGLGLLVWAWWAPTSRTPHDAPLRVVSANLYADNPSPAEAARAIAAIRPDVVVLLEATPTLLEAVDHAMPELRYGHTNARQDPFGIAVRCRAPCPGEVNSIAGLPSIRFAAAQLDIQAVHLEAPLGSLVSYWAQGWSALAARPVNGPSVLVGDLNCTPQMRCMDALRDAGWQSASANAGERAFTWPAWFPMLRLDHVLIQHVEVTGAGTFHVPGSDHVGVWVDLVP